MPPIHIEKLIFGGQGLARVDGKAVFVWNALPDEDVEVKYIADKKNFAEAVAVKIINPSPFRVEPKEPSFLSTSPWQILSWKAENKWKKQIAIETYRRNGGLELKEDNLEIEFNDAQYGYRNKMEFYFDQLPDGKITLAFLERGGKEKIPTDGSLLAMPVIGKYAKYIIDYINENKISLSVLNKVIIKCNQQNQVIIGLFLNQKLSKKLSPLLNDELIGFSVFNANNDKLDYEIGQNYLEDKILGIPLCYGIQTFFQVNLPIFEKALKDISEFAGENKNLIDYYSGAGAISLPIAKKQASVLLVENNCEAIEYANKNILMNNLKNCEALCSPSEKMLEAIDNSKIVIVDPPRAGLDKQLVNQLISQRPLKIIYLSCDLSTQARDIKLLSEVYKVSFLKLYNFFPRTPHIEDLCVLNLI